MLIVVRHGRTTANREGRLLGRLDVDLDDHGRRQADAVAAAVGPVDRVITSPLARTRQTAEAWGVDVEVDERWIELDYGEFDGVPMRDIDGDVWARWRSDAHFAPPRGESLATLGERVRSACDELLDAAVDQRLDEVAPEWDQRPCLGVVMAADGYPGSYGKGAVIRGLDAEVPADAKVFHAGTADKDGQIVTSGGRVLCVCALGNSVQQAQLRAYQVVEGISWEGSWQRSDIGHRAIRREQTSA